MKTEQNTIGIRVIIPEERFKTSKEDLNTWEDLSEDQKEFFEKSNNIMFYENILNESLDLFQDQQGFEICCTEKSEMDTLKAFTKNNTKKALIRQRKYKYMAKCKKSFNALLLRNKPLGSRSKLICVSKGEKESYLKKYNTCLSTKITAMQHEHNKKVRTANRNFCKNYDLYEDGCNEQKFVGDGAGFKKIKGGYIL